MESLLAILNNITAYSSRYSFKDLCWHALRRIASSREAADWDAAQRDRFMFFTYLFTTCGEGVFIVKDALEGEGLTDLNSKLITALVESLDRLEEFAAAIELEELNETIDGYSEILLNSEDHVISKEMIEFAASHFRSFFLTVYTLNIGERIDRVSGFSHC